ncbi:unnamed protein product [Ixodes pacificus]
MDVTSVIGDYGKFQRNIFMFCLFRGFPNGLHLVVYTFFFPVVEHWCAPPDALSGNMTTDYWKTVALPRETGLGGSVGYSSCSMFPVERVGEKLVAFKNSTVPCESWQYGESFYRHSLVQEWDLVCDSAWMRSLVQSATMAGMLVGSVLCSYLGDSAGKIVPSRPVLGYVAPLCPVCANVLQPSLLPLRWAKKAPFFHLMEVVGPCKRTTTAIAFSLGFAIGLLALPAFAWVFQDWRHLQAVISVPLVIFVAWSWYLPESPRWLVATGKLKKARKVLLQAGAANNIEIKNVDSIIEQLRRKITEQDEAAGEVNWFDLLRTRKVRRYSIILVYASMACGAVFYGLQFSVTSLGGDPYINFVLAAAAELPVCLLCYSSVRWCRRRRTMLAMFGVTGLCSVAVGLLIFAGSTVAWLRQCLGIVGKLVASASLTVIWMFAAEVFPTVLRTVGVGACLVGTRVGAALAPFIVELKSYTSEVVPPIILGGLFFLSAILVLPLPETFRVALPDTLHETEGLTKSRAGDSRNNTEAPSIAVMQLLMPPSAEGPAAVKDENV